MHTRSQFYLHRKMDFTLSETVEFNKGTKRCINRCFQNARYLAAIVIATSTLARIVSILELFLKNRIWKYCQNE